MGELIHGFEERRSEQLDTEKQKALANRAFLLTKMEYWAEKETDAFRAYEYAREQREAVAKQLGMFVMPHAMRPIDTIDE